VPRIAFEQVEQVERIALELAERTGLELADRIADAEQLGYGQTHLHPRFEQPPSLR